MGSRDTRATFRCCLGMHSHEQEIELHTIKTLPTLMLAASLSAGMILAAQPAFARNNGGSGQHQQQQQQQHNDHQDRGGMRNAIRSENRGAPGNSQRKRFAEGKKNFGQSYKKKKDKVNVTDTGRTTSTGDGFKVTHGGTPPRAPVASPSASKGPSPGTVTVQWQRQAIHTKFYLWPDGHKECWRDHHRLQW